MRAQATELGRVMLITDRRLCSDLVATIAAALAELPPRAALVQLREKDLEGRELLALATALLGVCRPRGAPLVINDRIDVVLASGADGVHLPERGFDLPHRARPARPQSPHRCLHSCSHAYLRRRLPRLRPRLGNAVQSLLRPPTRPRGSDAGVHRRPLPRLRRRRHHHRRPNPRRPRRRRPRHRRHPPPAHRQRPPATPPARLHRAATS